MSIVSDIFSCCFPPPRSPNPEILIQLKMKNGTYSHCEIFSGEKIAKENAISLLGQQNIDKMAILRIRNSYGEVYSYKEGEGINPISADLAREIIKESNVEPIEEIFSRAVQNQNANRSVNRVLKTQPARVEEAPDGRGGQFVQNSSWDWLEDLEK